MKRFRSAFLIAVVSLVLLPLAAKADAYPLGSELYSQQSTKGSTISYVLKGYIVDNAKNSNLSGVISYNPNDLEFVKVTEGVVDHIEGELPEAGTLTVTSKTAGQVKISYKNKAFEEGDRVNLIATFKVKTDTKDKINISFKDNYSATEIKSAIDVIKNSANVSDKNNTNASDNNINTTDKDNTTTSDNNIDATDKNSTAVSDKNTESSAKDNKLMYVSWGISGVLLVALIVVCLKKRQ